MSANIDGREEERCRTVQNKTVESGSMLDARRLILFWIDLSLGFLSIFHCYQCILLFTYISCQNLLLRSIWRMFVDILGVIFSLSASFLKLFVTVNRECWLERRSERRRRSIGTRLDAITNPSHPLPCWHWDVSLPYTIWAFRTKASKPARHYVTVTSKSTKRAASTMWEAPFIRNQYMSEVWTRMGFHLSLLWLLYFVEAYFDFQWTCVCM